MKLKIILFALILLPFLGISQQTINGTINHDGLQRDYIAYIPKSYNANKKTPLLFCFHGFGSTAVILRWYSLFDQIAEEEGFITIYPQGTLFMGKTHWNVGGFTLGSTTDDVGFVETLLDSMTRAFNIDKKRVYSTGMSNGGYMSFLLACQSSDKFAAIASVTGSMSPGTYKTCDPQHPMPVLQIHGTSDNTVPYKGDVWTKSISDVLEYWVNFNNCNPSPTITSLPDINKTDSSTVEHFVFDGGDKGVNTEHFKVTGGDHTWPGAWGNLDINSSKEIWKFLSRYDINGLRMTVAADDLDEMDVQLNIHPNPTYNQLTIEGNVSSSMDYKIISLLGEIKLSGKISNDFQIINTASLSPNMYILKIGKQTIKFLKMDGK